MSLHKAVCFLSQRKDETQCPSCSVFLSLCISLSLCACLSNHSDFCPFFVEYPLFSTAAKCVISLRFSHYVFQFDSVFYISSNHISFNCRYQLLSDVSYNQLHSHFSSCPWHASLFWVVEWDVLVVVVRSVVLGGRTGP